MCPTRWNKIADWMDESGGLYLEKVTGYRLKVECSLKVVG